MVYHLHLTFHPYTWESAVGRGRGQGEGEEGRGQ